MHRPDLRDAAAPNPEGKRRVRVLTGQEARSQSNVKMALLSFPSNIHLNVS